MPEFPAATIGVCGFGRCGSTMVMRLLEEGGVPPTPLSQPGSYELPDVDLFRRRSTMVPGHSVKLLDWIGHDPLPHAGWAFIWLDRDPVQQSRSQSKFLRLLVGINQPPESFQLSYVIDRPAILAKLRALGPVIELRYEDALASPTIFAERVGEFVRSVGLPFESDRAASVIHRRSPECAPGLDFELSVLESR